MGLLWLLNSGVKRLVMLLGWRILKLYRSIYAQNLCIETITVWSLGQLPRRLHASTDISGLAHMSSHGLHLFQVYEFHDD